MKRNRTMWLTTCLLAAAVVSWAQAANPASDFKYDMNKTGDGVLIQAYLGKSKTVIIPGTIEGLPVTTIGQGGLSPMYGIVAFGITAVTIPNSVTEIGEGSFKGNNQLTTVTLPNKLVTIGAEAFSECSDLTSIRIPAGVTSIGEGAFSDCSKLKTVALPVGLTAIPDRLFGGCRALTTVTIPNGVTSIGERAFFWCSALTSLAIPDSVTEVGEYAFRSCENLATVTVSAHPIEWGYDSSAFSDCPRLTLASKGALKATGYTGAF